MCFLPTRGQLLPGFVLSSCMVEAEGDATMASKGRPGRVRLAIVGAGAAGLVVARHALTRPDIFDPVVVYEQADRLGGTWVYTDNMRLDSLTKHNVHSSMYKNLRTNLPKEVMAYLDFPFQPQEKSFVTQGDVLQYLNQYADHFKLKEHIQFNSSVVNIKPCQNSEDYMLWEVAVEDIHNKRQIHYYDAVAICNGHFSEALVPSIPGLDKFKGILIHSHSYRQPEMFSGLRVLCLGAGFSAVDIGGDLTKHALEVLISHNKDQPIISDPPANMKEVSGVVSISEDGVTTREGQYYEVDVLILCTGYKYHFPFLSPECDIRVSHNQVTPLYRHMINISYPTMGIIGLPTLVCPFPLFDVQAHFYLATLTGDVILPSKGDMLELLEAHMKHMENKGIPMKYAHRLGSKQWDYLATLCKEAGCRPPSEAIEKLYKKVSDVRKDHTFAYKNKKYALVGEKDFVCIEGS